MFIELEIQGTTNCQEIDLKVFLDQTLITTESCSTTIKKICIEVDNNQTKDKILSLEMQGKNATHTTVDQEGNIVSDITIHVKKIIFDGIDVTETFCSGQQIYTHDFNGSVPKFLDEFYGIFGCNGTATVLFSTPIYTWFLKHEPI